MDSADNLIYAGINWVRTLILTQSERRSASNRSLRLRRGKQKVAGSRGLPKRTQGFFVNKPSVLLSSDGTPGSCEYSKQSGEKNKVRVESKQLWLFFCQGAQCPPLENTPAAPHTSGGLPPHFDCFFFFFNIKTRINCVQT